MDDRSEDRLKRLLDLVVLLLNASEPVPFQALAEQFEAYQGRKLSAERTFERDKADLVKLGIPIRWVAPDRYEDEETGGYVIDRRAYLLPAVRFTRDELAALVASAAITRAHPGLPYADAVDSALGKVSFDAPDAAESIRRERRDVIVHLPAAEQSPVESEVLGKLEEAVRLRKRVALRHRSAATGAELARQVDPYGLVYKQGAWMLVGFCHLRQGIRSFRLDRVAAVTLAPRLRVPDFERPEVNLRSFAERSPWRFEVHAPVEVELEVAAGAALLDEDVGERVERRELPDGRIRLRFRCSNTSYLLERVRVAGDELSLRAPPELLAELTAGLLAIAALHEAPLPPAEAAPALPDQAARP